MKERQAEEQRLADEERMRRQQEEMQLRMHHQEEEMRRRQQENTLFMQVIFRIGTWSIGVEALTCLSSGHTVALGLSQPLREMHTRAISWEVKMASA